MPGRRLEERMLTDLDAALERFHQSDFECGDGSANLGPVAVTALEALT